MAKVTSLNPAEMEVTLGGTKDVSGLKVALDGFEKRIETLELNIFAMDRALRRLQDRVSELEQGEQK